MPMTKEELPAITPGGGGSSGVIALAAFECIADASSAALDATDAATAACADASSFSALSRAALALAIRSRAECSSTPYGDRGTAVGTAAAAGAAAGAAAAAAAAAAGVSVGGGDSDAFPLYSSSSPCTVGSGTTATAVAAASASSDASMVGTITMHPCSAKRNVTLEWGRAGPSKARQGRFVHQTRNKHRKHTKACGGAVFCFLLSRT